MTRDELLNAFKQKFPIESLKNMTLEQYTDITEDENGNKKKNDSFTYWVENKTRALGSISSDTPLKFNIYKYKKKPKKYSCDDIYAWDSNVDISKEDVWEKTKNSIYNIAKYASEGKFNEIDNINDIKQMYKWKIAFLYSDKKIINIFAYDRLLFLAKQRGQKYSNTKKNFNEIYSFLLSKKSPTEDFWDYSDKLCKEWNDSEEKLNSIIRELKDALEESDKFLVKQTGKNFIWIGTKDSLIGNKNCHYEYLFDSKTKRKLLTQVHFEKDYKNILSEIQTKNKDIQLYKKDKINIWYELKNNQIDIDTEENYIEKAIENLKKLDEVIGEDLRAELKKIKGEEEVKMEDNLVTKCKILLENTHNLILHGAPGTGKTYLAKQIAEAMGCTKDEIGFVQFHPSYDYTDFVEGLRPVKCDNENIGFERKDGVFKRFCEKALSEIQKSNFDEAYDNLLNEVRDNDNKLELTTPTGAKFKIVANSNNNFDFYTGPKENPGSTLTKKRIKFEFETNSSKYWKGYYRGVINYLQKKYKLIQKKDNYEKKYVFIIDEINRGELSKIFGELFFCIDPGYRGVLGKIKTQYANMENDPNEFDFQLGERESFGHFFIPENVYIIGTMNDIDRSVENMDFAFRRRFTFKEIKAIDTAESIINSIKDKLTKQEKEKAINKMNALNKAIEKIEGLSSDYHIGGAYFKKLETLKNEPDKFEALWNYHLEGLLREYLRGTEDTEEKLKILKKAYDEEDKEQKEN